MRKIVLFFIITFLFVFVGCTPTVVDDLPKDPTYTLSGTLICTETVASGKNVYLGLFASDATDLTGTAIYSTKAVLDSTGNSTYSLSSINAGTYTVGILIDADGDMKFSNNDYYYSIPMVINKDNTLNVNNWKLYGVATTTHTVTFNSNGGSTVPAITTEPNTVIVAPTAPTKTGNTFVAWYKEASFTTAWNFATDKVTENITLYAKWSLIHDVSFNSDGGSTVPTITAVVNTAIVAPTAPTKTGYAFVGWYKESECTNAWVFATDKVTTTTTLYAKWDKMYYVEFESNGGSAVSTKQTSFNITITEPAAPEKPGLDFFDGWYKDPECTNAWNFGTDKVTVNIKLYAKWTAIPDGVFTKTTGVYTYTLPISEISTVWGGTTISPSFTVVYMTDAQAALVTTPEWATNFLKSATTEDPVYQSNVYGNMRIKSTSASGDFNVYGAELQSGVYKKYQAVVATVNATEFILTVDMDQLLREELKILANGNEAIASPTVAIDMTDMKPYVIALGSQVNDPTNYIVTGWNAAVMKMTLVGTAIPVGVDDFPVLP